MTETMANGVDLDALKNTIEAVEEDRSLGEVTFAVNGEWTGGFRVDSKTGALTQAGESDASRDGKYTMSSDEPAALLGTDTAVSPAEYVLQALAGCYTVTLAANAASRGIDLKSYTLHLEGDFDLASFLGIAPEDPPGASQIRVDVTLDAPEATREELEELVDIVTQRSPIRDTLVRPVDVVTTLT
ncbi:OsmC family protein [Brevibacterium sp. CFH 10365]|uniref:OsmC family protein n=1 Tax=Brevibacterium sp. CFH 10365 TaxID=2585207 RepID=UPI0012666990|nr:OsmC family protein [Brevibacterium sp. CFH 10365]